MDVNGVKVMGALTASGARVFARDGVAYVASSVSEVRAVKLADEPRRWGGGYRLTTASGERLVVLRAGCACKADRALGAASQEQLIEAALVEA
jgi:hypothetical protein